MNTSGGRTNFSQIFINDESLSQSKWILGKTLPPAAIVIRKIPITDDFVTVNREKESGTFIILEFSEFLLAIFLFDFGYVITCNWIIAVLIIEASKLLAKLIVPFLCL